MAYKVKVKKQKEEKYKVDSGRVVTKYGQEIFSIRKEEGFSPTEADAMTHYIADELNKKDDFERYHRRYLGK